MEWHKPKDEHIVYEALSAIADCRFEIIDSNHAKSVSTSKSKFYSLEFDLVNNAIMSNDNLAYYRGEVSYPMVALLLSKEVISYDRSILEHFKGIMWKKINQKNKNDYMKSVHEVLQDLTDKGVDVEKIRTEVAKIYQYVCSVRFEHLGPRKAPPSAY